MSEDEVFFIIFAESLPSPECVSRWELERSRRERVMASVFSAAASRQREKLAKNSQGAARP